MLRRVGISLSSVWALAVLNGCGGGDSGPSPQPTATANATTDATSTPSATPNATASATPLATPLATATALPNGTRRIFFIPQTPFTSVALSGTSGGTRNGVAQAGDEGSGAAFPLLSGVVSYNIAGIRTLLPSNARVVRANFSFSQRVIGDPYSFGPLELRFALQNVNGSVFPPARVAARDASNASVDIADALRTALDTSNPARAFQLLLSFDGRTNRDATRDITTITPDRLEIIYTLN